MKKIKMMLLVALVGVLATGCVKFNANMDIKSDKSMDFSIIYAIDKSIFGEDAKLKEEDFAEVKKDGFTITKYSDGNMEGFTFSRKIKNIDDVSTESDTEYNLSGMMNKGESNYIFKVVKGESKNTYYAKFKFDANDSGLNDDETSDDMLGDEADEDSNSLDGMDFSSMMSNMDLSFNVTLPNSAISNNATKTDDNNKKLTWNLSANNQQYIEFAFELNNGSSNNILLYVGIGVIALIIIIVLVILMSKKNNGNKEVVNNTNDNHIQVENDDTVTNIGNNDNITEPEPMLNNENK